MRKQKRMIVFCMALVACLTITGIAAFQGQRRDGQKRKKAEYPVVDYNAPEIADAAKREKRRKKEKKYDDALVPIDPSLGTLRQYTPFHFPSDITPLPVSISAAVIVGTVTDAQAHLSPDKSNVYSEFNVLVDDVVKNDAHNTYSSGKLSRR